MAYTIQTAQSVEAYIHGIEFIADGSGMPYGVVQVIYVDHEAEPVPS